MAVAAHDVKTRMEAMLSAEPEPVVVRVGVGGVSGDELPAGSGVDCGRTEGEECG